LRAKEKNREKETWIEREREVERKRESETDIDRRDIKRYRYGKKGRQEESGREVEICTHTCWSTKWFVWFCGYELPLRNTKLMKCP
jgi:tRNA nucleotidyltransferase (CCA-adding enzyme)